MGTYRRRLWLFLLPYVAGTLLLVVIPALATATIAFADYNAIGVPRWVGLDNFRRLFESPYVRISLYNTLIFVVTAVPLRVLAALGLALLLQRRGSLFGLYRSGIYLPTVVPEVAYALVWLWIFNPFYGPLNLALHALGLPAPEWLVHPSSARLAIVILLSFQIGEGLVILLAGLQSIPLALHEAAAIDGAGAWSRFWWLTLPLLAPWLLLLTVRDLLMSLQATFTPSFVLTYGGPYYATTFLPLLVYELAFDFFDFGMAAALLLIAYLPAAALVIGALQWIGRATGLDEI